MSKRKPKRPQPAPDLESLLEQEEPQVPTFTEIGGSPVPGLTLRHVLRGHTDWICRIAWSPDGSYLASPSADKTIRIWDARNGACVRILQKHTEQVISVAWSPDGQCLASGSHDETIRIWDTKTWEELAVLLPKAPVNTLKWSPNGLMLAASFKDSVQIWDLETKNLVQILDGLEIAVPGLDWSSSGEKLVASTARKIRSWSTDNWVVLREGRPTKIQQNITMGFYNASLSHSEQILASGSNLGTIHIWEAQNLKEVFVIEGHIGMVYSVSFSKNDRLLASKSSDNTIRLWDTSSWVEVACISESTSNKQPDRGSLAFHPTSPIIATLGESSTIIRIWEVNEALLLGQAQEGVHYTTAKLVLVGDSGVGKTGLGWRLAKGEFKEHASTHGQQFWPIKELGLKRKDGTECEAVLWDLAGQHAYRQIHSIFLDNVAAAMVLFDPSNRQEPLKGVQFWLEQLKGKGEMPPVVLVGARVDVSPPALSQEELEQFCQRYGVRGGYISTSAKQGEGLDALLELLKAQIPWDEMTATVTTVTFKRIKDYVLALKERPDREGVLVGPPALREQLQATDSDWRFTDAEMLTAVGHLETHGYVAVLRSSAGEQHILLAPDLLVTLASSVVFLADKNPRELGAVSETELLRGAYPFEELVGLAPSEQQILLDAATLRFLQHNICFRETLEEETLLIFPALIKQKRPLQDDLPSTDDISYIVRGRVENLYASLVVLLGYTPSFTRINQWQNQAQYEMGDGEICGFRLIEDRQGEIELVLYYGDRMPAEGRSKFQELFEQFLYQRDVDVTPFPPVVCPQGHQLERATVIKRSREGKTFAFCDECGHRTGLPDFGRPQNIGTGASPWLRREEAVARLRSTYEVHLTRVKSYRRAWSMPRCYVSHVPEQSVWAEKLIHDLRDAGAYVVEQAAHVQPDDFVIVLDTDNYQKAYRHSSLALTPDIALIRARLGKRHLVSLALEEQGEAHQLKDCTPGSFGDETHYPASLFDLVLNLYAIPLTHAGFAPLRQALHEQWEQMMTGVVSSPAKEQGAMPLKVFISYAHKDEAFKDDLLTVLKPLERKGVLEIWHDRQIEEGDEWRGAIETAMSKCDMALLFISKSFLASPFIQDAELPRLLQRRKEEGLRVVPIIIRPCMWQSEPVLADLQALPKDGKAVIKFSTATGRRDQVWTDIAAAIEKRAKARVTS